MLCAEVLRQASTEAMQFSQIITCLVRTILNADSWGGTVFMFKIDLVDAYIRVWIRPE